MKTYFAVEHGEFFTFDAKDKAEAKETAPMWGAQLLGECPKGYEKMTNNQILAKLNL